MKKLILVFILLMLTAAGAGYYFYSRITYQPTWYADDRPDKPVRFEGDAMALEKKIVEDLKKGKKVQLGMDQLVLLAATELESQAGFEFDKVVRGYRVTMAPPDVEVEMMVDTGRLPLGSLPQDARATVEKVLKAVPADAMKALYVRSRLTPAVENGALRLGATSGISIGKIDLPLEKLEEILGEKAEIPLSRLPAGGFKLLDNAVLLLPKN